MVRDQRNASRIDLGSTRRRPRTSVIPLARDSARARYEHDERNKRAALLNEVVLVCASARAPQRPTNRWPQLRERELAFSEIDKVIDIEPHTRYQWCRENRRRWFRIRRVGGGCLFC